MAGSTPQRDDRGRFTKGGGPGGSGLTDRSGRPTSLAERVRQHRARVLAARRAVLDVCGKYLVAEMHYELSIPGTGRQYRKSKAKRDARGRFVKGGAAGRIHTASAPGRPPARDEGSLYGSVTYEFLGSDGIRYGTPLKTGAWMEHGTLDSNGHVAPRPWLLPVTRRAAPAVRDMARQGFLHAARGAALGIDIPATSGA